MPINQQDQLNLLKDILSNHQIDCCGSVSECEQLERLVKSLISSPNVDQHAKTVLEEIYNYSQNGINSSHLDNHIEMHQQELSGWVNSINQFS
ncbi:YtzH-like family protein [Cytobacillus sp.]|uniref:YtzH-like family protein n=1 Tax=Cytobacillus sp. TaxID=2675269 RepID=UPI0028BE26D3|nr:YtzH-like family protein [Cytobacillus sp.]